MANINITQEDIDKHVADTEVFWNTFHNMLKAPYSHWRELKSLSLQEWVDGCWNEGKQVMLAIQNLSEYPVLKGEGLVVCTDDGGMLLTNYRFIYSEGGSLINIPLHNLLHYDIMSEAKDTRQDLVIKYLKNGNEEILRIDEWIKDEVVRSVRQAAEWGKLDDVQKHLLDTSIYELNNEGMQVPKIGMLPKTEVGCFKDWFIRMIS